MLKQLNDEGLLSGPDAASCIFAPQEKVTAVRRRQMRHVLFTEPEVIEAGTQASACNTRFRMPWIPTVWVNMMCALDAFASSLGVIHWHHDCTLLTMVRCLVITADTAVLQPARHAARVAGGGLGTRRLQQVAAQQEFWSHQDDAARRRRRALCGECCFCSAAYLVRNRCQSGLASFSVSPNDRT